MLYYLIGYLSVALLVAVPYYNKIFLSNEKHHPRFQDTVEELCTETALVSLLWPGYFSLRIAAYLITKTYELIYKIV